MTKREIAEAAQDCLQNIINEVEANLYYDVDDDNLDDVMDDAGCAADDIAVHLEELQALLREASK